MTKDFESWLAEYFCEHNPEVLDDSLPDAVSDWLCDIGPDELIELAEKWHIAKKDEEIRELVEALQCLYDEQNGAPLIKHQKDWEEAMDKAESALNKHKTINE